ncbi:unnamed protein product [Owenia fusiformis]|uniref:G-protein coupled receptors family 1 profile domain-containing protein n=2 Tax=Owenia fusiformis TaxID=6347 RepID=A0A8S4MWX8_OWEFU|nr:unnamed protein product [Owenia fusiformis]
MNDSEDTLDSAASTFLADVGLFSEEDVDGLEDLDGGDIFSLFSNRSLQHTQQLCAMNSIIRSIYANSDSSSSDIDFGNYYNSNITCNDTIVQGTASDSNDPAILTIGRRFYVYLTPIIILIGLIGNSLSLKVFTSRRMRKQSSSYYLATLSGSDLLTLLLYVLPSWLKEASPLITGDQRLGFIDYDGVCHLYVYFAYVFRFLSVWLIVIFTVERYIGVCHPLRRREMCTTSCAGKGVISIAACSLLVFATKPALSGVYETVAGGEVHRCTSRPNFKYVSFIFDSVFAVLTTFVPFIIILSMNSLIVRKLFLHKKRQRRDKLVSPENRMKIEFTLILLTISTGFIALSLPYFVAWCKKFNLSQYMSSRTYEMNANMDEYKCIQGLVLITQTIFFINYCSNFFLYSLTGAYFRSELKHSLGYSAWQTRRASSLSLSRGMSKSTRHSWV